MQLTGEGEGEDVSPGRGLPGISWEGGGQAPVPMGGAGQCVQRMRSSVGPGPGRREGWRGGSGVWARLQLYPPPSLFPAFPRGSRPPLLLSVFLAEAVGALPPPPRPPASWCQAFPGDSGGWRSSLDASQDPVHLLPAGGQNSPPFLWDPDGLPGSSVPRSTWDLKPVSTQEKPGLSMGVAGWLWPGAVPAELPCPGSYTPKGTAARPR